mgnify:CR=1 FL=1
MNKKIIIQLLILILTISIVLITIYFYFFKNIREKKNSETNTKNQIELSKKSSNKINNLKYISTDNEGNEYEILSETGEIDTENQNIIYMSNVTAIIKLINQPDIFIKSDFAKYNSKNYETNFKTNVKLTYIDNKITGENLDLSFQNNEVTMYNKVIYTKPGTKLNADRLEIDLLTKNSKIFMDNKFEKVKIISTKK